MSQTKAAANSLALVTLALSLVLVALVTYHLVESYATPSPPAHRRIPVRPLWEIVSDSQALDQQSLQFWNQSFSSSNLEAYRKQLQNYQEQLNRITNEYRQWRTYYSPIVDSYRRAP